MSAEPTADQTDLKSGPFSVLYKAVKGNTQVLVNVRNNHKLLGRVKAYDRHMNLWVVVGCVVVLAHAWRPSFSRCRRIDSTPRFCMLVAAFLSEALSSLLSQHLTVRFFRVKYLVFHWINALIVFNLFVVRGVVLIAALDCSSFISDDPLTISRVSNH